MGTNYKNETHRRPKIMSRRRQEQIPDQQPMIYPPYQDGHKNQYYQQKKPYLYEPKKSRSLCNSICLLQLYSIILLFIYVVNTTMLGLTLSGNLNIYAFQYLNAYCPRKMEFLLILQIVVSGFGTIYYALQLCVSGSTKITKISSLTGHLLAYILIWICLKVATA